MSVRYLLSLALFLICTSLSAQQLLNDEPISRPETDKFMFLINADPQMGDQHTEKKGLKRLNDLLSMFVEETNNRTGKDKPSFVVWNGDLVWDAFQNAFDNFERIVKKMTVPSVLVHGNHDGYNDDPKFLNLQKSLSGYQKLNYAFDYGKWRFVVISAQEKYLDQEKKQKMLKWLDDELRTHKDKQIMLFMHYHILPTGLSQMEFYTYFPMAFKNKMLDTITRYKNVKYVFSGHVHIGIKASIKTAVKYKGTNFILAPTPVFARPFGEEFPKFRQRGDEFDRRGFYMEVHVDGDKVSMVGRKIKHPHKVKYPKKFKAFEEKQDIRAFTPEGQLPINKQIINPSFDDGLSGWYSSYRYQKDRKPMFVNKVFDGKSQLHYTASFGSWTFDEYMENYQTIAFQKNMRMQADFNTLPSRFKGSGGYFRIFAYDKMGKLMKILLFHWGTQENKIRFMPQSWAYNATGDRHGPLWLDKKISEGDMLSYKLNFQPVFPQKLQVDIHESLNSISSAEEFAKIHHIAIGYGVWGRVTHGGRKFTSVLNVDAIDVNSGASTEMPNAVMLNGEPLTKTESELDYGYHYKRNRKK